MHMVNRLTKDNCILLNPTLAFFMSGNCFRMSYRRHKLIAFAVCRKCKLSSAGVCSCDVSINVIANCMRFQRGRLLRRCCHHNHRRKMCRSEKVAYNKGIITQCCFMYLCSCVPLTNYSFRAHGEGSG